MRFLVRMAVRETRASWARLVFFFICLAIGVGAIVGLRSVVQNARAALAGQAKGLIAADLIVSSGQPWSPETQALLARRLTPAAGVRARSEAIETTSMVRPADARKAVARMVEIRAVDAAFPLYGRVELAGGQPYGHHLLQGRGVIVRPELATQLDVAVGDPVVIGGETFTIRGVLQHEPGRRVGGFSLGPRVLMDRQDLQRGPLLSFGARARYQLLLRVDDDRVDGLLKDVRSDLKDQFVSARSWRTTEDDIGEDLRRTENYLSLVGLAMLVLGGIGVSSVTRVFIEQKLRSIAVLKCVGASTAQVVGVYLLQVLVLGIGGSLLGVVLARVALPLVPAWSGVGGVPVEYALTTSAVAQGVGVGLLVAILFSAVPLLRVRHVRPSLLLRQEGGGVAHRRDWLRWAVMFGVGGALVGLASWQAGSLRVGLAVSAGLSGILVVLYLSSWVLVRLARPLRRSRHFALRHAALHLDRPGNQTRLVLMAVGLGCFFIVGVRAVQANLLAQMSIEIAPDAPDLFLIDVQRDQAEPVAAFLADRSGGRRPRMLPVLRARVTAVKGKEVNLDRVEDVRGRGWLAREFVVTYRPALERNEQVVEGRFWDPTPSATPEVSIEAGLRKEFRILVGDEVRFDVLGRTVTARVTSVRRVNWRDARAGGFMFVFRPGTFESAPHGYITPLRGPDDVAARARLQRDLVERYPNVSVIDLREVLDAVRGVVRTVTVAVTVVGTLVLFTGILILAGAVAMTKFKRVYEAAIFKTLGGSTRLVGALLLTEYGLIGLLAGLIGASGGAVLSWGISRYVVELPWTMPWRETVAGLVLATVSVAAVGLAASLDVLRRKPLATLRAE